jgi:hypothetical protein
MKTPLSGFFIEESTTKDMKNKKQEKSSRKEHKGANKQNYKFEARNPKLETNPNDQN